MLVEYQNKNCYVIKKITSDPGICGLQKCRRKRYIIEAMRSDDSPTPGMDFRNLRRNYKALLLP
jgi:hypothetical protein